MAEHHDDSDHEEHIDERWLVSYADMMTLLFGLFVMLFSIASENTGHFDEELRAVSGLQLTEAEKQKVQEERKTPVDTSKQVAEELRKQITELKASKIESDAKVAKAEELAKEAAITAAALEALKIEKTSKETEIDALKKQIDQVVNDSSKSKEEAEALKAKLAKTAKPVKADPKPTPVDVEAIKRSIASEKDKEIKDLKAKLARVETPKPTPAEKPVVDTKELERKLATAEEKEKKIEDDKTKLEEKNKELQEKIADLEKNAPTSRRFMMVVLKWSSEKHDLDLSVTDPAGKSFNFKRRKFAGHPGEFTLDSRSGPGAEIWQTEQIIPGVYTISWKLYNAYGNSSDVVYSGVISSNAGKIDITERRMPASVGASNAIRVKVDAEGKLTRL